MPLNEKMIALMNAVRNKYAVKNKLGLDDATKIIGLNSAESVIEPKSTINPNNSKKSTIEDNQLHFVCSNNDVYGSTGIFCYYDQRLIIPGKRYRFSVLIRGNMELSKIGEERSPMVTSQKLNPDKWSYLSFAFVAKSDIVVYCKAKRGDWLEIKNWCFSELGGVVNLPLFALVRGCAA